MTTETTVPAKTQSQTQQEQTRSEDVYVMPPVDIYEDDQGLILLADLPGVDPSALEVKLDNDRLTIQARAMHLASGEPIHREYTLTGFYREFQIMEEIDADNISAVLKNGVLVLKLPRAPRMQPRKVEVRSA